MQLKIFSILLGLAIISISVPAAYSDTIVGLDTRCFELLVPPPVSPAEPETPCDEGTGLDKEDSLIALLGDFGIPVCDPVMDPGCDNIESTAQFLNIPLFLLPPITAQPCLSVTGLNPVTVVALHTKKTY